MADEPFKKKEDAPRGAAEYMLTWGDMQSLLLAFFVVLFALSSQTKSDVQEFKVILSIVQGSLGILPGGNTISERQLMDAGLNVSRLAESNPGKGKFEDTKIKIQEKLSAAEKHGDVSVYRDERGVIINITDSILFNPGDARIRDNRASGVLDEVVELLRDDIKVGAITNAVRIEGHSDDDPVAQGGPYRDNWELSTARAISVLRHLEGSGKVSPDRLSAVGYGEYHPVSSNDTDEGKSLNRRVEIVVLKGVAEE